MCLIAIDICGRGLVLKIKNLRWWIVGLLFFATALNYIDRNVLSVLEPMIKADIDWTPEQWGQIGTAFWLSYGLMAFLIGRFIDKVGTKLGYAILIGWWGLAATLHGIAGSVMGFMVLRFMLGLGEAGMIPGTAKACAEWFPKKERGLAYGIALAGMMIGGMVAPLLSGWLAVDYGWPIAFFVTGGLCGVWLAFWLALFNAPAKHKLITEKEKEYIVAEQAKERALSQSDPEKDKPRIGLLKMFLQGPVLGIGIARFLGDPVYASLIHWIPKYMNDVRGIGVEEFKNYFWIPFAASAVGSLLNGTITSFLVARGMDVIKARKTMLILGAVLMPFTILIVFAQSFFVAMLCLCIAAFGHMVWVVATQTLPADMLPSRYVGYVTGTAQTTGSIGNALALWLVGLAVMHFGNYHLVFILAGIMHPIGTLIMLATVKNTEKLEKWVEDEEAKADAKMAKSKE